MVRERLAEALDEAQAGHPVFIERRGVTYRISVEAPGAKTRESHPRSIEILDAAIERGAWVWEWNPRAGSGLRLRARKRK